MSNGEIDCHRHAKILDTGDGFECDVQLKLKAVKLPAKNEISNKSNSKKCAEKNYKTSDEMKKDLLDYLSGFSKKELCEYIVKLLFGDSDRKRKYRGRRKQSLGPQDYSVSAKDNCVTPDNKYEDTPLQRSSETQTPHRPYHEVGNETKDDSLQDVEEYPEPPEEPRKGHQNRFEWRDQQTRNGDQERSVGDEYRDKIIEMIDMLCNMKSLGESFVETEGKYRNVTKQQNTYPATPCELEEKSYVNTNTNEPVRHQYENVRSPDAFSKQRHSRHNNQYPNCAYNSHTGWPREQQYSDPYYLTPPAARLQNHSRNDYYG